MPTTTTIRIEHRCQYSGPRPVAVAYDLATASGAQHCETRVSNSKSNHGGGASGVADSRAVDQSYDESLGLAVKPLTKYSGDTGEGSNVQMMEIPEVLVTGRGARATGGVINIGDADHETLILVDGDRKEHSPKIVAVSVKGARKSIFRRCLVMGKHVPNRTFFQFQQTSYAIYGVQIELRCRRYWRGDKHHGCRSADRKNTIARQTATGQARTSSAKAPVPWVAFQGYRSLRNISGAIKMQFHSPGRLEHRYPPIDYWRLTTLWLATNWTPLGLSTADVDVRMEDVEASAGQT